jgi:PncC family amidohydrolase
MTTAGTQELDSLVDRVAAALVATNHRVVFAESCTGGLISATLAHKPGISAVHCGSMVTYRNATKAGWLKISQETLNDPGPVSAVVADQMATAVLSATPEATISASVTGHVGPDAPAMWDGVVFIAIARRISDRMPFVIRRDRYHCRSHARRDRQQEVVGRVLELLATELESQEKISASVQ